MRKNMISTMISCDLLDRILPTSRHDRASSADIVHIAANADAFGMDIKNTMFAAIESACFSQSHE